MKKLLLLFAVCFAQLSFSQSIFYVDSAAAGTNSGTSWGNAYTDLQLALEAAQAGDEIWVAKGTYYPSKDTGNVYPTDPRRKYFTLVESVGIYGGFDATETQRSQRDWEKNPTTLSGDIGMSGVISDNSYHVVASINGNLGPESILDGFSIVKGNADMTLFDDRAYGGGVHIWGPSQAILKNLDIRDNQSGSGGALGFVDNTGGAAKSGFISVVNCKIRDNFSTQRGGGVFMYLNRARFINCLITNNLVTGNGTAFGGAGFLAGSKIKFFNCTVSGNTSTNPMMYNGFYNTTNYLLMVANSIWDDISYTNVPSSSYHQYHTYQNSIVKGSGNSSSWSSSFKATNLGGNMDVDPLFKAQGFRLRNISPAKNAGLASLLPKDVADLDEDGDTTETLPLDVYGFPRVYGTQVDMGASEYQPVGIDSLTHIMCPGDEVLYNNQMRDTAGTYSRIRGYPLGDTLEYFTVIIDSVSIEVDKDSSGEFTAREALAGYQWVSCDNDSVLAGDTLRSFTPVENGSYAVIITNSTGCTDTSACYTVTGINLEEEPAQDRFSLHPNPAREMLVLRAENAFPGGRFEVAIYRLSGEEIYRGGFEKNREKELRIDIRKLSKGLYILKMNDKTFLFVKE